MKRRRIVATTVAVLAAALLLRAMLPIWITEEINRRMATLGPYRGHIQDVDLSLYRGAYRIVELRVEKRSGKVPVPLLEAPRIDLAIGWRELLDGALVGEAIFHRPQINFVDGREQDEDQTGRGVDWRRRIEALFPLRLDRIVVHDGEIAFRSPFVTPAVDLRMQGIEGQVSNLTNIHDASGRRDARLLATAKLLGHAALDLAAQFDPFGTLEEFSLQLRVTKIRLTALNGLARAYAAVDIASGQGNLVLELEATQGHLQGYAKPLLDDLEVLDWEQDIERDADNPLRLAWEALSGAITGLFRNQPQKRFATRIPIEGEIGSPDIDVPDAIVGVLRNAFVEAYDAHFENDSPVAD